MTKSLTKSKIRVALVVPHIFLQRDILPNVIFSPGVLALELASGLANYDIEVTLFTPGPVDTDVANINADLSYFESELAGRGDSYIDLLKKHPFVFITLARQVQSELIAKAFSMANNNEFDLVHIYTNEEDTALPFSKLCNKPVVFTHHDPFNFLIKYKNNFPKYPELNWLSLSMAQRRGMPENTNWIANIYHGLNPNDFEMAKKPTNNYIAYLGRIIEPKGVHLAIQAVREHNKTAKKPLTLKIAGKHYADDGNDDYWQTTIEPEIDETIQYVGLIKGNDRKSFLNNAKALIIPSIFDEPFGMVMIEALASGTPLIGLNSGSIPEIIDGKNGIIVKKATSNDITAERLAKAIGNIDQIDRRYCRQDFDNRFTLDRMCSGHAKAYRQLIE
jgi:glycosyltransferase involved in cell wall biosynthesis